MFKQSRRGVRRGAATAGVALLICTLLAACAANGSPDASGTDVSNPAARPSLPQGSDPVELDPAEFTTEIDNPYWPMQPNQRWTYREVDETGTELIVHVTVTDQTKTIANGVVARVVRDTVFRGDEIVEDTFDWYAQHLDGSIWYLGEDTAEFENGEITSTHGSFEAGVDGALPGIALPGDPQPGMQYRQEYYAGEAEDNGEIVSLVEMVDVAYGHFDGVLMTKDTITIEPGVLQYKFYARGVGLVMALDIAGGAGGREELVSVTTVPAGTGTGPLGQPD